MKTVKKIIVISAVLLSATVLKAQQTLTLEECRHMAVSSNKDIKAGRVKMEMAEIDKKTAFANWFPEIKATGACLYNEKGPAFINDNLSGQLRNAGTVVHSTADNAMQHILKSVAGNPAAVAEYMNSPLWQTIAGELSGMNLTETINRIGEEIDNAMHPDMDNVVLGVVSLQQPVFAGGKIIKANQMAQLASELSKTQYDSQYQETLVEVDRSYWQIVSIANKLKLADAYAELLHNLENDVNISIEAGVMTQTDLLQIKVKVNEADMLRMKAENGLVLAKMLLCKQIGLETDSDITLKDENLEEIPLPPLSEQKSFEQIYADRPELRSLDLVSMIYDKKIAIAGADMMPRIALTANYIMAYPNIYNGFDKEFNGSFNAGIMINIPVSHASEKWNRTRKAKVEATLHKIQYEDAKNMINLQVNRLRKQQDEAWEKLNMARNNMSNAEENLRTASAGFEAGMVPTNTVLAAHVAWLQAHSEFIDAGIELQMNSVSLMKAEGSYSTDRIQEK